MVRNWKPKPPATITASTRLAPLTFRERNSRSGISGWAALVWEPVGKRLLITQIYDHQSNLAQAGVPLMVLDAWEHAYYLQYENRRPDYVTAIWNVIDWTDVTARFEDARGLVRRSGR